MNPFMISAYLLIAFMVVSVSRVALGPYPQDRVVGLDTTNMLVIVTMIMLGVAFENVILIDVAIVYAILSYVATLYLASYLEGRS